MDFNPKEFLEGKIRRDVRNLYINFLFILEDLRDEKVITIEEYNGLRKRVLDFGNSTIRGLEEQIQIFDIRLKGNESENYNK